MKDSDIRLYGLPESVYARIVRLVLTVKAMAFAEIHADPFEGGELPADYGALHPFKRIPALEIDGQHLYETDAIVSYLDDIGGGPTLTPADPLDRAHMRQLMRIIDNYGYRPLVWGIYVPGYWREGAAAQGEDVAGARRVLQVLARFERASPRAAFREPTLATFYIASTFAAADSVPLGASLIDEQPHLREWWNGLRSAGFMAATRSRHTRY